MVTANACLERMHDIVVVFRYEFIFHTRTHCTGDPSLVHSHYVAIVLPWQQPIRDLVALGRLGAKVKKNLLLCSLDPQGAVEYFTLHWAGF